MTIEWTRWDSKIIKKHHGKIYFYRDLYEGNHGAIFPRAADFIKKGDLISEFNRLADAVNPGKAKPSYITANISKLIPEIPAMLVSRAVGRVSPANDMDKSDEVRTLQAAILEEIEEDSNLTFEHYTNVLQQQIDGGLVGIVTKEIDDTPIIEMKARDTYFPHDDGRGADLALEEEYEGTEYLHILRERIERGADRDPITKKRTSKLTMTHLLFVIERDASLTPVDDDEAKQLLGLDELETEYKNRRRGFIHYWANNKTFNDPLGRSALVGQESKQEEINWTLTRNSVVYERNGKPRIVVNKKIMKRLQDIAYDKTGDESKISSEELEIVEYDDNGKSMEVIQIDISKIGNMEWIKDLMKMMFVETQTSEKAVDFYIDGSSTGGAISGVAKFYDLFTSIIKADKLAKEYIAFLQNLYEAALYMEKELGDEPDLPIEKPDIALHDMIPISRKELLEQEGLAFEKKIQSRFETVKRIKPNDSDESIEDEIALIESEQVSDDSTSLSTGRQTLSNLMDNRDGALTGDPNDPENPLG